MQLSRYSPLSIVQITTVVSLIALSACKETTPPAPIHKIEASHLPKIVISAESSENANLLLTYYDVKSGSFKSETTIAAVPELSRGWVRVVDLRSRPEKRRDHELVYVADLRKTTEGKYYPYIVMSRKAFEVSAAGRITGGASEPLTKATHAKQPQIILYGTTWCPACRKARSWLNARKLPFLDKDIERDQKAAAELMAKAASAGISPSGVPVLDVKGTLVPGFSPQKILTLLGGHS